MRPSKGGHPGPGHIDQWVDGYRARLTPENLTENRSQGPVIPQTSSPPKGQQSLGVSGTDTPTPRGRGQTIRRKVAAWVGTRRSTLGQRKATGQVRNR